MSANKPTLPGDPLIASSWARSGSYGLAPEHPPRREPAPAEDLNASLEANVRLAEMCQPLIEHLFTLLDSTASMVLLADTEGLILRSVGDVDFVERAARVMLHLGARWDESVMGTNAIGTALHEERMVAVCRDEHFLERNRFLTCIATPIVAPGGGLLGVIDISCDARVNLPHAEALLATTAELIEHRLLTALAPGRVLLRFSDFVDLLDSPMEGVALIDEDGSLVASNRRARALLKLPPSQPLPCFDKAFEEDWQRLGHFLTASQGQGMLWLRQRHPRRALASHLSRPAAAPGISLI